jgi:hypothetical protein
MSNLADVFNDDVFSLAALTDGINSKDYVPGLAGKLTFAGNGQGVPTTDVIIEYKDQALSIIPTTPRGAPAPVETKDKAKAVKLDIPHIQLEDVIHAGHLQNVRAFGSGDLIAGAQEVVNQQLDKMSSRLDLTLEHMRLGALKGRVLDADGTELLDLYAAFSVSEPTPITFPTEEGS